MELLENVVQPYAWGSKRAIAELLGRAPSSSPEAELWMGAHPSAPSRLARTGESLLARIERDPESTLGGEARRRFGDKLPFLLKVLAADAPLSLQAHPSLEQARAGFDAEEEAGVPLTAPHRKYKDRNHKPELLCALGPFEALCGFRAVDDARALFEALGSVALGPVRARLREGDVRSAFSWLMREAERGGVVAATVEACARIAASSSPFAAACAWSSKLAEAYPGDVGVTSALLLNHVVLSAGEAIYLPAGNLHAYLRGVGVELMANSDNVLRGGLTPKHVDVDELLAILDFRTGAVEKVLPVADPRNAGEELWSTPAPEFRLSRVHVASSTTLDVRGPEILLCTDGTVRAGDVRLARGQSAFVAASERRLALEGQGTLYRAAVQL